MVARLNQTAYLMGIPIYYRLLFELKLAGIVSAAFDSHGAIMITVNFTDYNVVYGSCHLSPLKCLAIFKLKHKYTNRIQLDGATPKFTLEIRVSPEFPTSALTVTGNNHGMVTDL